jgi:hypothetical protein
LGLLDDIFNGVLFVLIGLQGLQLKFTGTWFLAALSAIPLLLLVRWLSVAVPVGLIRPRWHSRRTRFVTRPQPGTGRYPRGDLCRRGLLGPRAGLDDKRARPPILPVKRGVRTAYTGPRNLKIGA